MTTCRDIITQAMYRTSILALGRTPKAKEAENGMFLLQGLYDDLVMSGSLGGLTDVYKSVDYTVNEFERVYADGATITLPETIMDDGVERTPADLALVVVNDGTWRSYIWDGSWVELTGLTLDDTAPLATRGQDGLACYLAANWVDTFGGQVSQAVYRRAMNFRALLMGQNATAVDLPEYF